jgi:hypothetical protein
MAGTGFHSVVANHAQMCTTKKIILLPIATMKIIVPRIATCSQESKCAIELLWQTAVHLRAICQWIILVVTNRGIGAQFASKE